MGRQIEKGATFLGVPMVKARNVLKAWANGSTWASVIANRRDVMLDPGIVTAILHEFEERGLIGQVPRPYYDETVLGLTEAGNAFVTASGRRRTAKAKAQTVLDQLLERCDALGRDPKSPLQVDQVWVFGSLLKEAVADVGDIDVVVLSRWSAAYEALPGDVRTREANRYAEHVWPASTGDSIFTQLTAYRRLFHRNVFGPTKHPLLSPGRLEDLVAMACPCRLAWDAQSGGRVDEPILDKHPLAGERDVEAVGEPLEMPDLAAVEAPLRPLPARQAEMYEIGLKTSRELLLVREDWESANHGAYRALVSAETAVLTKSEGVLAKYGRSAGIRLLASSRLDGVDRFGLVNTGPRHREFSGSALVERSIEERGNQVEYRMSIRFSDRKAATMWSAMPILARALMMAAADVRRAHARLVERGLKPDVSARFEVTSDNVASEAFVASLLQEALATGFWLGSTFAHHEGGVNATMTPDLPECWRSIGMEPSYSLLRDYVHYERPYVRFASTFSQRTGRAAF